jgi:LytS/YehU family sensor histidine kinase
MKKGEGLFLIILVFIILFGLISTEQLYTAEPFSEQISNNKKEEFFNSKSENFYTKYIPESEEMNTVSFASIHNQFAAFALDLLSSKLITASNGIEQRRKQSEDEIQKLNIQKNNQRNIFFTIAAFLILITSGLISRLRYIRRTEKEKLIIDFKHQLAEAETKVLRAQMNPHFIFNCLNSINCFITQQQHELASDYLIQFSKLIRLILDNSSYEMIEIDKELEILTLYISLENARFENKFFFEYQIDNCLNIHKILIPPMLLQPFVENAIWHGLMHKDTPGKIFVSIKKQGAGYLKISIIDDGIGREKAKEYLNASGTYKSHGMEITAHRIFILNMLNSTDSRIDITDLKDINGHVAGTQVDLLIPYII